jgi:hypothetical protein
MRRLLLAFSLLSATPALAQAQEERDLCADRPGIASTTCTVERGRVQVELAIDWSFQDDGEERTDVLLAGDSLVRVGIDDETELQLRWAAFGAVRTRDATGIHHDRGLGDVSVGMRRNLRNPDGGGTSAAIQAAVTLPVGGSALGAGDWGASLLLPLGFGVGDVQLLVAPGVDAAVDQDRHGRHFAYGLAVGGSFNLSERLSAVLDLSLQRDLDPLGHTTEALAGLALSYQPSPNFEVDLGAIIGLNADSPDFELYLGAARRF